MLLLSLLGAIRVFAVDLNMISFILLDFIARKTTNTSYHLVLMIQFVIAVMEVMNGGWTSQLDL